MIIISEKSIKEFEENHRLLIDLGYSAIGFNCQYKLRKSDIERNDKAMKKFKEIMESMRLNKNKG